MNFIISVEEKRKYDKSVEECLDKGMCETTYSTQHNGQRAFNFVKKIEKKLTPKTDPRECTSSFNCYNGCYFEVFCKDDCIEGHVASCTQKKPSACYKEMRTESYLSHSFDFSELSVKNEEEDDLCCDFEVINLDGLEDNETIGNGLTEVFLGPHPVEGDIERVSVEGDRIVPLSVPLVVDNIKESAVFDNVAVGFGRKDGQYLSVDGDLIISSASCHIIARHFDIPFDGYRYCIRGKRIDVFNSVCLVKELVKFAVEKGIEAERGVVSLDSVYNASLFFRKYSVNSKGGVWNVSVKNRFYSLDETYERKALDRFRGATYADIFSSNPLIYLATYLKSTGCASFTMLTDYRKCYGTWRKYCDVKTSFERARIKVECPFYYFPQVGVSTQMPRYTYSYEYDRRSFKKWLGSIKASISCYIMIPFISCRHYWTDIFDVCKEKGFSYVEFIKPCFPFRLIMLKLWVYGKPTNWSTPFEVELRYGLIDKYGDFYGMACSYARYCASYLQYMSFSLRMGNFMSYYMHPPYRRLA